jgi:hypothetical protein
MTRGRKVEESGLVERLQGSAEAKARLVVFLETLSGRRAIGMGALSLGVSERRFYQIRDRLLQAALDSLESRSAGRRPHRSADSDGQAATLEAQVRNLRLELRAAQIREEMALAMPHLLRSAGKKAKRKRVRRRPDEKSESNACDLSRRQNAPKDDSAVYAASAPCANWKEMSAPTPLPSVAGRPLSV